VARATSLKHYPYWLIQIFTHLSFPWTISLRCYWKHTTSMYMLSYFVHVHGHILCSLSWYVCVHVHVHVHVLFYFHAHVHVFVFFLCLLHYTVITSPIAQKKALPHWPTISLLHCLTVTLSHFPSASLSERLSLQLFHCPNCLIFQFPHGGTPGLLSPPPLPPQWASLS
jgi:hypothetical protein